MKIKLSVFITVLLAISFSGCRNKTSGIKLSKTTEVVEAMQGQKKALKPRDGIFIHLTSGPENPQRVLMALSMAKMMSDDNEVLVYADIKGIYTLLKDAPDITFKGFPSSLTLLNELKEKGVHIIVCPECLKAADKTAEDLMDSVQMATKEKFFDFCDGKIISISY